MTATAVTQHPRLAERVQDPVVVALLDGGPDDAEVVEVALAACRLRGVDLRVVYVCGMHGSAPTPLTIDYARGYAAGAVRVAELVPGVRASASCLPAVTDGALGRELVAAELLVAPASRVLELRAAAPQAPRAEPVPPMAAVDGAAIPGQLRLGYRLALQRELERELVRADGSTTPEELDDAWHVGVAYPPLRAETIDAWAACSAWPRIPHPV